MLKQELLDYITDLRQTADKVEVLIESFDVAKFDWENATETQLAILRKLHPLRNFFELRQDASMEDVH